MLLRAGHRAQRPAAAACRRAAVRVACAAGGGGARNKGRAGGGGGGGGREGPSAPGATAAAVATQAVDAPPAAGPADVASALAAAAAAAATPLPLPPPMANSPPLGFSNNIVLAPAGAGAAAGSAQQRQQQQQRQQRAVADCSSDEELADDADADADVAGALVSPPPPSAIAPGGGRASSFRCLVLDSRWQPVNCVSWFRAVVMGEAGTADVLETWPNAFAYSAYRRHALPAVLRVHAFVDVSAYAGKLSLTRKNLFLRDRHACVYCGCQRDLTLDHVTPVCLGGRNSWTNLVTACMACNQRKGGKTLQQLGWTLPAPPREPTPQEVGVLSGLSRSDLDAPPSLWEPYLESYKAILAKAQRRAASRSPAGWPSGGGGGGIGGGDDDDDSRLVAAVAAASARSGKARSRAPRR